MTKVAKISDILPKYYFYSKISSFDVKIEGVNLNFMKRCQMKIILTKNLLILEINNKIVKMSKFQEI